MVQTTRDEVHDSRGFEKERENALYVSNQFILGVRKVTVVCE